MWGNTASTLSDTNAALFAPRVLIIDDEQDAIDFVRRALTEKIPRAPNASFKINSVTEIRDIEPFLKSDSIDIYIVDLKLRDRQTALVEKQAGEALVQEILKSTSAGVIVYSSEPVDLQAVESLLAGADDYIAKGTAPRVIQSKVLALWRRVQYSRPSFSPPHKHTNRVFLIGKWRFTVGSRELLDDRGESVRVSPIEHAFLSHIVTAETPEIDKDHFNAYVLGRETYHNDRRIDNLVSRLRTKLGDSAQFVATRNEGYRLLGIVEIR